MVPLIAALTLMQTPTPMPIWALTEFQDQMAGRTRYGKVATRAVAEQLRAMKAYEVVPEKRVDRAIKALKFSSPPEGPDGLSRLGNEILGKRTSEGTLVVGQVVDYRFDPVDKGRMATAALRMVAYDAANRLPVNATLVKGESEVHPGKVPDEKLIEEAIRQAAEISVRSMRLQEAPAATVLNTAAHTALIDQGSVSGYLLGSVVIFTRGNRTIGTGRVRIIEENQAEVVFDRVTETILPGDRVRQTFNPPILPPVGILKPRTHG